MATGPEHYAEAESLIHSTHAMEGMRPEMRAS